jgi:hypothetical protein
MHLLLLSDFAAVMHVQRPEDGPTAPAQHSITAEEAPAAPSRSGWTRFIGAVRGMRLRRAKPPVV